MRPMMVWAPSPCRRRPRPCSRIASSRAWRTRSPDRTGSGPAVRPMAHAQDYCGELKEVVAEATSGFVIAEGRRELRGQLRAVLLSAGSIRKPSASLPVTGSSLSPSRSAPNSTSSTPRGKPALPAGRAPTSPGRRVRRTRPSRAACAWMAQPPTRPCSWKPLSSRRKSGAARRCR